MSTPQLSVVVPCYNEAAGLPELLDRFARATEHAPLEVVLVDNGSTDDSAAVLERELPRFQDRPLRVVTVETNRGYGFGIMAGLRTCLTPMCAITHADLQTDPYDVVRAWELMQRQPDPNRTLVKGRRRGRPRLDHATSAVMGALASVAARSWLHEVNAQPKLFPRAFLEQIEQPPDDFNLDLYLLFKARRAGLRVVEMDVTFPPRPHGVSSWASTLVGRRKFIETTLRYIRDLARDPPR